MTCGARWANRGAQSDVACVVDLVAALSKGVADRGDLHVYAVVDVVTAAAHLTKLAEYVRRGLDGAGSGLTKAAGSKLMSKKEESGLNSAVQLPDTMPNKEARAAAVAWSASSPNASRRVISSRSALPPNGKLFDSCYSLD